MKVTRQVELVAKKTGKSKSTVWRWRKNGCDISSSASLKQFLQGEKRRQNSNTVQKSKKENASAGSVANPQESKHVAESDLNQIALAPVGERGAAAALARLEEIEERAHARLLRAIEIGNPFQVKAAQEFHLRASESLRRLDLAVEVERRKADERVPKFLVEQIAMLISAWLRIAFAQFLSAESPGLMAIADLGEFKACAIERFKGILHREVRTSLKSNCPMPTWAADRVIEAWNIPVI